MSPTPSRPRRRIALPAGALLATLAAASPAAAQTPPTPAPTPNIPVVEQPLQADGGLTSIGNGVTAWVGARDDAATKHSVLDVWVLRDGVPTRVTTLRNTVDDVVGEDEALREGAFDLEAGTTAAGDPVAVLRIPGTKKEYRRGVDRTYLIRLDTGAKRRLPSRIDGLLVYGTAIDAGRLYSTVGREKLTKRGTFALWRSSVTTTRTGKPKKLRTSQRGAVWYAILADRGRVAIDANVPSKEAYYDNVNAFGTPHGRWNRAADIAVSDGPIPYHAVAGFTKDGSALVTFLTSDDQRDPVQVTRTPIDPKAPESTVGLGTDGEHTALGGAFDPETGRILTSGPGPDGRDAFGYSGVAFAPGG